ncbi:ribosome biogenesis protein SLX9 homolog [Paramormyrops kingsleyae]|uniref:SLX9 ribosome biogenesis factor n=1 Tax=Paramormyrops kingsleyae TaxID=1676925 RepID=A0A3B3SX29_9TELE|nr:protein FAM207A [Paramormyrops kingsleyae]
MVGKIKRVRQKLHQRAVKCNHGDEVSAAPGLEKAPTAAEGDVLIKCPLYDSNRSAAGSPKPKPGGRMKMPDTFPSAVFAGTEISPEALVQTLKTEQKPADTSSHTGPSEKKLQSKKQRTKERRERWLSKISAIKLAKEQQVALTRRRATPVVGDMQLLADALPELSQLVSTSQRLPCRKASMPVKKKPEPTDYRQMKPVQKRKLLETESSRFSEMLQNPAFRANPLYAIGEHLRKRLKEEEEKSPR